MNERFTGVHKQGQSLFCVAPGDEIVSSGPYFLTAYEALAWGFHYYALTSPAGWPSRVDWDEDLPLFPQGINWQPPPLLNKSYYNDLPPVLIEIKLEEDYSYSLELLEDESQKFDKNAFNYNADKDTITRAVTNFYDPKLIRVNHESKLARYDIYMRIQYEAIEGMQKGTKPDKTFIDNFKYDRMFKSKSNKPFFWRRYQALRLAAPQNAIRVMARSNLDWPTMLLKFLNYFTFTRECDYSKFETYLLENFPQYIVYVDLNSFGLQMLDANLLYLIASNLNNRYDFIHLMSVNKKTRRLFDTNNAFKTLFYRKFSRNLHPDFFVMLDDSGIPYYYNNITASKNDGKLGRIGLVADYTTLSELPNNLAESEKFQLIENCNSYFTMVGMCLSCCWSKKNIISANFTGRKGLGMVNRMAQLPFLTLTGAAMFSRTNRVDPVGAVKDMTINSSWAFDFPSGCVQNREYSQQFLQVLQATILDSPKMTFGTKIVLRLHNPYALELELTLVFKVMADRSVLIHSQFGPYHGFVEEEESPFNRDFLKNLRYKGIDILVEDVQVALNPYQVLTITSKDVNSFIGVIYPFLNYAVRYTIINKEVMRADLTVDML